jgi:hypothetical protein
MNATERRGTKKTNAHANKQSHEQTLLTQALKYKPKTWVLFTKNVKLRISFEGYKKKILL